MPRCSAAVVGDRLPHVVAVEDLAAVRDVADGVQVGEEPAVIVDVEPIADAIGVKRNDHVQSERPVGVAAEIVNDVVAERDGFAGLDQRRRLAALLVGDEVGRTHLVVVAPAAPVRQLGHPLFELFLGRPGLVGRTVGLAGGYAPRESERGDCNES